MCNFSWHATLAARLSAGNPAAVHALLAELIAHYCTDAEAAEGQP